jgi:cation:H+ antiporter
MPVWRTATERRGAGAPRARAAQRPRTRAAPRRPAQRANGAGAGSGPGAPRDRSATLGNTLATLPVWEARLALIAACAVPGVVLRFSGTHVPPPLGVVVFGGAVMAAAFLIASAAEALEIDNVPGVAVALVAFVAILPEYAVEVWFAFSGHVEYVTASLTGSTRLLLGCALGMPAVAALLLGRGFRGGAPRVVSLNKQRRVDLAIIGAASLYAPLIVARGHMSWPDAAVLLSLYGLYLRRVRTGTPDPPALVGVAAELALLTPRDRRRWVSAIMGAAAVTVLITIEPFVNSVLLTGTSAGISPYLLVQWLVPMATEMPELVVAFALVRRDRAGQAVAVLLSSAVSQWTLALGTIPLAYAAGAGSGPLPLLGRERVEMLLTTGQGLMAVAVLMTLRLERRDTLVALALFAAQIALPSTAIRAALTAIYLVIAVDLASSRSWALPTLARALRPRLPRSRR